MKFLPVALLLFCSSVNAADCAAEAKVAVRFMNQYLAYTQAVMTKRSKRRIEDWLNSNKLVSPSFVAAYKAKEKEGLQLDPELGWDIDIILDAQDSPDKGFQLFRCASTLGFVELQGTDWTEFKVTVRVSKTPQGLRVVGAGLVNIPNSERAKR